MFTNGISPDYKDAFIIKNDTAKQYNIETEILRPVLTGKQISRYNYPSSDLSVIYLTANDDINKYKNAKQYMLQYKDKISCTEVKEGKHPWFSLHRPRSKSIFDKPKFVGFHHIQKIMSYS